MENIMKKYKIEEGKVVAVEESKSAIQNDEVGKFWVVTKPTEFSEIGDIFYESNIADIALQFKGGLNLSDIMLITKSKSKAEKLAKELLDKRK